MVVASHRFSSWQLRGDGLANMFLAGKHMYFYGLFNLEDVHDDVDYAVLRTWREDFSFFISTRDGSVANRIFNYPVGTESTGAFLGANLPSGCPMKTLVPRLTLIWIGGTEMWIRCILETG